VLSVAVSGLYSAPSDKKDKPAESYSVVAGSVFREPGFALAEAHVVLTLEDGQASIKVKKMTFTANTRGEFAFRVPATAARYRISATAKGFISQQKTIEVQPSVRIDVTFTLAPESNQ